MMTDRITWGLTVAFGLTQVVAGAYETYSELKKALTAGPQEDWGFSPLERWFLRSSRFSSSRG